MLLHEAILLAAGSGERLWPFTETVPKPLLPVANRSALDHNIHALLGAGLRRCFVNTYTHAEAIERVLRERDWGLELFIRREMRLTGPAGGARVFLNDLQTETVLVVSGDVVHEIDLLALADQHRRRGSLMTVALHEVDDARAYGVATLASDGRIVDFVEKPVNVSPGPALVSCGIYCVAKSLLSRVEPACITDFGRDLLPDLSARGAPVYGYVTSDYWCDIGRPETLLRANLDGASGVFSARPRGREIEPGQWVEENVTMHSTVRLLGPMIIGAEASLQRDVIVRGPTVIGARCVLAEGSRVTRSVLLPDTCLGPGTLLANGVGACLPTDRDR